ncbi:hypothetical protein KC19_2G107000 [Ceratodon purpureus]|uniref:TF-B3 domain-containing protein n=1 Tax=Ceratodon purpureus TaxID=3225 RepID=A0A8T0ISG2_CERPU|nr:hypothetical protein KC19_2G107000 [Ceratodon purpureus]
MASVTVSESISRMEPGDEGGATLANDTKIGEFCSSGIQVAINEGNRQGHSFFVVKMGKTGCTLPFQQVIPADFSRYHLKLHLEDITLEGPCGRSWGVTIRPLNNVLRFARGWRQFAVENHLREGYQLLFHLVGKSRFVVRFFDSLGVGHASFPPLTPTPAFVGSCSASRRNDEVASEAPPLETRIPIPSLETAVAEVPPPFEAPVDVSSPLPLEPPLVSLPPLETSVPKNPTKLKTPRAKTPGTLNSDDAKDILRQFFTQVRSNPSSAAPSNSKAAVPTDDMPEHILKASAVLNDVGGSKTEHGNQESNDEQAIQESNEEQAIQESNEEQAIQESNEEQAIQESNEEQAIQESKGPKYYIFIDSDDDDRAVKEEVPELSIETPRRRDFSQRTDNKRAGETYSLGEETGFYSPGKVCTPMTRSTVNLVPEERVQYVEQDYFEGGDDSPLECVERQRSVRRRAPPRRACRENKVWHDPAPFAPKSDAYGNRPRTIRDLYDEKDLHGRQKELRVASTRGDSAVQRAKAVENPSLAALSPAKFLLTQQGCMNYSEIISKSQRGYVTVEERQRPLIAATKYARSLKSDNFLVVMNDYHVYRGFRLSIPRDFLEATGTLTANKVKVCLIDRKRTCYETKWKWQASWQTPFMNCDGWALFALDHKLEEGDVCVFQLMGPGPAFLLSVHIFTVEEYIETRDNSIRERRGGPSVPFNQEFGRQAPTANNADRELRHVGGNKRHTIDLGRPSLKKTIQKPYNLQAWTKLFKPSYRAQFGGNRG